MGSGGKASSPPPPVYTAMDGTTSTDPNMVAERNRQITLASALGFNVNDTPAAGADGKVPNKLDAWVQSVDPTIRDTFYNYDKQGLTAADYRAETRLKEQEQQAAEAEDIRQKNILSGRSAIDEAFGSYDDNYFNKISQTVLDYYLPQLEEQFGNANEQMTYKLARQGLTKSDTASNEFAKLKGRYDVERGGITNRAQDEARAAREAVSAAKSQLQAFGETAADPAAVNNRLASETGRFTNYAPDLSPMAQVFTDYLSPAVNVIGTGLAAEAQGFRGFNTGLFDNSGRSSSQRVVRSN